MFKRVLSLALVAAFLLALLSGCGRNTADTGGSGLFLNPVPVEEVELDGEAVALAASPAAVGTFLTPDASGRLTAQNAKAVIDYSNTGDGYVMVRYTAATQKRLKVIVQGPTEVKYQYNVNWDEWTVFPLSDGNGQYEVTVYENTTGSKYAAVLSKRFSVALEDEFAPFLRPNQYVNYTDAAATVAKAQELTSGKSAPLEKVAAVYEYVVSHLTYDRQKAKSVQSGYLPDLDAVLQAGTGICFDYAALMAAMLRCQGVPCKLVVGYAGTAYHAWISVWTEEAGWIEGVVYFDGAAWQRMDPTFASSGNSSAAIMEYIGDGSNYTAKYIY